jgi:hypothetical protein
MAKSFPDEAHTALVETNIRSKPDLIEGPVASITRAGLTGLSVTMKSKKTNGRCCATYLFDGARDITLMHCVTGSKVPSDSFSESFRRVN